MDQLERIQYDTILDVLHQLDRVQLLALAQWNLAMMTPDDYVKVSRVLREILSYPSSVEVVTPPQV